MKIPLIKPDLPPYDSIEERFQEVLSNGKVTNFSKYVGEFEELAKKYLGTPVITVSSGTQGLILTLQALSILPGTRVVVPSFTFMATAQAITYAGAIPLFADISEDLTLSVSDLEELLAEYEDVSAVLPVHTYGLPSDVNGIGKAVEKALHKSGRRIPVIYDAAHAFGSVRDGQKVGSFGAAEVFSLSITKALTSVEGGLVSSHDTLLIEKIRKMRNYGMATGTYNAELPGLNGKMSEFHAIVGIENLKRLEGVLAERAEKATYFLKQIQEKTPFEIIPVPKGVRHTFKDFTVLVPKTMLRERQALMAFLRERGVETRAYFYPPIHEQTFFKKYASRSLRRTEELARRVITLPFYTTISYEEMDYVVNCLTETFKIHA